MDDAARFAITLALDDDDADSCKSLSPTCFNTAGLSSFLEISEDKLEARYNGHGAHGHDVGAMQANFPCPLGVAVYYYYEVTVLSAGESGKIGVGYADPTFKLSRRERLWTKTQFLVSHFARAGGMC